jgi:hypothetical protein
MLRGASWRLTNSDGGSQRSTRGGQLTAEGALATAGLEVRDEAQDVRDSWTTCALSGASLPEAPAHGAVVACALGRLYFRDAVVLWLTKSGQFAPDQCDERGLAAAFGHLERLRDVFPVILTPNPNRSATALAKADSDAPRDHTASARFICPIDRSEAIDRSFVALRPCGHVLRGAVAKEIARSGAKAGAAWACPVCSEVVETSVELFPAAEAVERRRRELREARAAREERKKRKRPRDAEAGAAASGERAKPEGERPHSAAELLGGQF